MPPASLKHDTNGIPQVIAVHGTGLSRNDFSVVDNFSRRQYLYSERESPLSPRQVHWLSHESDIPFCSPYTSS